MNISGIPEHIVFAGNMPEIIISDAKSAGIKVQFYEIAKPRPLILNETYVPDSDGLIRLDLKSVLTELVSPETPTPDTLYHTPANVVKIYALSIDSSLYTLRVIGGGISPEEDATTFLLHNFLTWKQGLRRVSATSPVFLYYIAQEDCLFKISARFDDGSESSTAVALTEGDIRCFNVSPDMLSIIFAKKISACHVWIESYSGCKLTDVVYIEVIELPDNAKEYFYANSLGGFDSIICTGQHAKKTKTQSTFVFSRSKAQETNLDHTCTWVQNTGYLTVQEAELVADFLLSKSRFLVSDELIPIIIEDSDNTFTDKELNSFEFEYRLPEQTPYRHLPHKEELTPGQLPPFSEKIGACFDQKKGNRIVDRIRGHVATLSDNGLYIEFPELIPDAMLKTNTAFWLSDIPGSGDGRRWAMKELTGTHTIDYATDLCTKTLFFRDNTGPGITSVLPLIIYREALTPAEIEEVLHYLEEYYFLDEQTDGHLLVYNGPTETNNTFVFDNSTLKP